MAHAGPSDWSADLSSGIMTANQVGLVFYVLKGDWVLTS